MGALVEEEHGEDDREEGLHSLDGVRERDGHEAEGEVGQCVSEDVHERQRRDGAEDVGADDDGTA